MNYLIPFEAENGEIILCITDGTSIKPLVRFGCFATYCQHVDLEMKFIQTKLEHERILMDAFHEDTHPESTWHQGLQTVVENALENNIEGGDNMGWGNK